VQTEAASEKNTKTTQTTRQEPRKNTELLNNASVKAFSDQMKEGLVLPAKSVKLDDKVWWLNEAIQKAVKEVLPLAYIPNTPWIKASTLLLAKAKRGMKQRRQESNEHEKEYRKLCNVVRKGARTDK